MQRYLLLVLFTLPLVIADSAKECPSLCKCDMAAGLRRARCVNKRLTSIEARVPSEVQSLDLSYNLISSLKRHAFMDLGMTKLIILNISHNGIEHIAYDAFTNVKMLQILDLSSNRLQSVPPDLFETNLLLKSLSLAGNQFLSLQPGAFLESKSLQTLNLSRSLIPYFYPDNFSKLPRLSTLDISRNFLIQIDVEHFRNLSHLKVLELAGNKWNCNTKMINLIGYLRKNNVDFENICGLVEKSQKMVVAPAESNEDEDQSVTWVNDCDIESFGMPNMTNICTHTSHWRPVSLILLIATFTVGAIVGALIHVIMQSCVKLRKPRRRKYRREEHLMRDFNEVGMSTPVLNRVQRHGTRPLTNLSIIR